MDSGERNSPHRRAGRLRALKGLPPKQGENIAGRRDAGPQVRAPVPLRSAAELPSSAAHQWAGHEDAGGPPAQAGGGALQHANGALPEEIHTDGEAAAVKDTNEYGTDMQSEGRQGTASMEGKTGECAHDPAADASPRAGNHPPLHTQSSTSLRWPTPEQRENFLKRTLTYVKSEKGQDGRHKSLQNNKRYHDDGKLALCGSFPFQDTRHGTGDSWEMARFLIVPSDDCEGFNNVHLVRYFVENAWEIPRPDVILTITGGAQHFDLPSELKVERT
jgi:hypothetical protein